MSTNPEDPQDLVEEAASLPKRPENKLCADCETPEPDWASLNIGILLCIKCAGVHRNLGVHQSKVRSLHLDTECWDRSQLDFMFSMGNEKAKAIYEAKTPCWYLRPSVDQDSAIVRENWIRAKYERKEFLEDAKESPSITRMPEKPREGYLWKANKSKVWQKRYFVLHGRFLYYYKTPSESYPKGVIDICELSFKLPHGPDNQRRYVFEAQTAKRTFPFGAESVADMLDWVHALKRAAAYYITLINTDRNDVEGGLLAAAVRNQPTEKEVLKLSYQQMGSPVIQGFLSKQGGRWRSWNRRLCVVTEDSLFYFKKDKPDPSDLPEGGIPLDECYVSSGDVKAGKSHCICLITPARVYFLCAANESEKQEWQTKLTALCDKLNSQRLVDFSSMDQPAPVRGTEKDDDKDDDSD